MSDLHLNFCSKKQIEKFFERVKDSADAMIISGDIGEAPSVVSYLRWMEDVIQKPIYFVLGNHDFYHGSMLDVQRRIDKLVREDSKYLHYLTAGETIELTPETTLVGHDGWGDGRNGDYDHSEVVLNDWFYIGELVGWSQNDLKKRLLALGDRSAFYLHQKLASITASNVIVVTHVPPFPETCFWRGAPTNKDFLPFYTNKAVGEVLKQAAQRTWHGDPLDADDLPIMYTVLCGHTHGAAQLQLGNLTVKVMGTDYGSPTFEVLEII
jgi:predicted MPP superfamily phosphohydrolase